MTQLHSYKYEGEPIPPGPSILETAAFYGMTKKDIASRTGYSVTDVARILRGDAPVTEDFALLLEKVLGMSATCLCQFERNYQQQKLDWANKEKLLLGKKILNSSAVRELMKRNIIAPGSPEDRIDAVLRFYKVGTVKSLTDLHHNRDHAELRHKQARQSDPLSLIAWLRLCELEAEKTRCQPYVKKRFRDALKLVRKLTTRTPESFLPELVQICADAGVAVVCVPEFPRAYVKGAANWLTTNKAMIALNLYESSNDVFWFTFFHEASHILLDRTKHFLSNYPEVSKMYVHPTISREKEANKFSEQFLIPRKYDKELLCLTTKQDILAFAEKLAIAPGIIVGRLQHEKLISPKKHNDLKQRFKWRDT